MRAQLPATKGPIARRGERAGSGCYRRAPIGALLALLLMPGVGCHDGLRAETRQALAPQPLDATIDERGMVLVRDGTRTRVPTDHLTGDSRLLAVALTATGPEDAVIAHGPGGAVMATPGVTTAGILWSTRTERYGLNDMMIASPWRHVHRLVDADGDGRKEIMTSSIRHMDVGTERKRSAHDWDGAAFIPVTPRRTRAWHEAMRRADDSAVEQVIAQRLTSQTDSAESLRLTARADPAARDIGMGEPTRPPLIGTRTTVRVGTDVAYLVRVSANGGGTDAVAYLAIVRTIPATKPRVLATTKLGPYPVVRPPRRCVDGFDGAESIQVRAWDASARAIVVRYHSGAEELSARVVRWNGKRLGPALEPIELARCDGPMHALRVRPRGGDRPPVMDRVEIH